MSELTPSDIARIREWVVEWHEKRDRALAETEHSTYRVFGLEGLLADKTSDLLAMIDVYAASIMRLRNALLSMGVAEAIVDRITADSEAQS